MLSCSREQGLHLPAALGLHVYYFSIFYFILAVAKKKTSSISLFELHQHGPVGLSGGSVFMKWHGSFSGGLTRCSEIVQLCGNQIHCIEMHKP